MTPRLALILLLGIDAILLLSEASSLSLTYHGAKLLYEYEPSSMTRIIQGSIATLGQNDVALRLPMIVMNLLSALLLYAIAKPYAKYERERVWLVGIFLLLPGIISSSLLVDSAALTTLGLFLYLFLRQRYGIKADVMLPLLALADASFMFLFFGLAVYALKERTYRPAALYSLLVAAMLWGYGFKTGGLPQNQFLDTIGLYAAIFSPIVFVYMVYVLYRRFISSKTDLIWAVSASALVLSLVLSFRQRIEIEAFAPFLMVALPLGMQTFYQSYRVRLRPFRKRYRILFTLAMAVLMLNAAAGVFNKAAYLILDNPSGYFAYRAHVAKELAAALKKEGVVCAVFQDDPQMQLRMRFYGIDRCESAVVSRSPDQNATNVTISYYNVPVSRYFVTKIPKN